MSPLATVALQKIISRFCEGWSKIVTYAVFCTELFICSSYRSAPVSLCWRVITSVFVVRFGVKLYNVSSESWHFDSLCKGLVTLPNFLSNLFPNAVARQVAGELHSVILLRESLKWNSALLFAADCGNWQHHCTVYHLSLFSQFYGSFNKVACVHISFFVPWSSGYKNWVQNGCSAKNIASCSVLTPNLGNLQRYIFRHCITSCSVKALSQNAIFHATLRAIVSKLNFMWPPFATLHATCGIWEWKYIFFLFHAFYIFA